MSWLGAALSIAKLLLGLVDKIVDKVEKEGLIDQGRAEQAHENNKATLEVITYARRIHDERRSVGDDIDEL